MQAQYNDIKDFINDLHNEVSVYQTVIDMGLIKKDVHS